MGYIPVAIDPWANGLVDIETGHLIEHEPFNLSGIAANAIGEDLENFAIRFLPQAKTQLQSVPNHARAVSQLPVPHQKIPTYLDYAITLQAEQNRLMALGMLTGKQTAIPLNTKSFASQLPQTPQDDYLTSVTHTLTQELSYLSTQALQLYQNPIIQEAGRLFLAWESSGVKAAPVRYDSSYNFKY